MAQRTPWDHRMVIFFVIVILVGGGGIVVELLDDVSYTAVSGDSMEHGEERQVGIVDDGDGAIITPMQSTDDLRTYYHGRATGYSRMGDYGDVVVFRVSGGNTKFLHRLVFYIEFNNTERVITADIPELGIYNVTDHHIVNYGFAHHDFLVNFNGIYQRMKENERVVLNGYITKGDNRLFADQSSKLTFVSVVAFEDIIGLATVVDNELVQYGLLGFVTMLLPLVLFLLVYTLRIYYDQKGKSIRHYNLILKCTLLFSLAIPLIYSVQLVRYSYLEFPNSLVAAGSYLGFTVVATGLGLYISSYTLKRRENDKLMAPLLLLVILIPVYFLMKADLFYFYQSMVYVLVINSIFHLNPGRFFSNKEDYKTELGTWALVMGMNVVLYIFLILVTWPPLLFLCFGAGAGIFYFGSYYLCVKKGKI